LQNDLNVLHSGHTKRNKKRPRNDIGPFSDRYFNFAFVLLWWRTVELWCLIAYFPNPTIPLIRFRQKEKKDLRNALSLDSYNLKYKCPSHSNTTANSGFNERNSLSRILIWRLLSFLSWFFFARPAEAIRTGLLSFHQEKENHRKLIDQPEIRNRVFPSFSNFYQFYFNSTSVLWILLRTIETLNKCAMECVYAQEHQQ